jgi:putative ABC transport system permease protein
MLFAIPLAWLQLKRERMRLFIAIAGIGFAVFLMFVQLGFRDALFNSAVRLHENVNGDIMLISTRSNSLISIQNFPQRRLYGVLGAEGVDKISPIYVGFGLWKNPFWEGLPKSQTRQIMVLGIDPNDDVISVSGVDEKARNLIRFQDQILFDKKSRAEFGPIPEKFVEYSNKNELISTEIADRKVTIAGLFELGASFGADGNSITSEANFLRIFTSRDRGDINIGVIKLKPGADLYKTLEAVKKSLPGTYTVNPTLKPEEAREDFVVGEMRVLSKKSFIEVERKYWQNSTAIGFIFTLGTVIGFLVGIIIVYQILYTDVTDHLAEYATLKAMGYKNRYLLKIVFQEAMILSIMGYIPGCILASLMYTGTRNATALPLAMTTERSILVLFLAITMCLVSGAIAVRKVQDADPADIF